VNAMDHRRKLRQAQAPSAPAWRESSIARARRSSVFM
jgi:hypothetical protein